MSNQLPIPPFFDPDRVGQVWRVPYQERAEAARQWAVQHHIQPASADAARILLVAVDAQNTFCLPDFELFVGGRSGRGAVADNVRLCEFLYRNLGRISQVALTMDTHQAHQIFHPVFWVDGAGNHPAPHTTISLADLEQGVWRVNPAVAPSLGATQAELQAYVLHYAQRLTAAGKFELTIWPFHAMLGGIGHAIVAAVEEAAFFHAIARSTPVDFQPKGNHPLTENYSALGPEVLQGPDGRPVAPKNSGFLEKLLAFDAVIIAGQAMSHCVAWTVQDLLTEIQARDPQLARKVYLLADCTSPVVVPGVVDYTDDAQAAFARFAAAGMHVVRATEPLDTWLRLD